MYAPGNILSTWRRPSTERSVVVCQQLNMAGVLFEDIFNVKDIDPEGKKFDRGEFISEFTFQRVRVSTCRGDARAIFIARIIAFDELLDLADSAGIIMSTWCK